MRTHSVLEVYTPFSELQKLCEDLIENSDQCIEKSMNLVTFNLLVVFMIKYLRPKSGQRHGRERKAIRAFETHCPYVHKFPWKGRPFE